MPVVASEFGLMPLYESQRRTLPTYAVFFCLLGFAYVFNLRHALARTMFHARLLGAEVSSSPLRRVSINQLIACLILTSLAAAAIYLWAFERGRGLPAFPALPPDSGSAVVLAISYIAMFLMAESAFAVMAVREYLQDVLHLSDPEVITGFPFEGEETLASSFEPDPLDPFGVVGADASLDADLRPLGRELSEAADDPRGVAPGKFLDDAKTIASKGAGV